MKFPSQHKHFVDTDKIRRDSFVLLNLGYGFLRLREDHEEDMKERHSAQIFKSFGDFYANEVSSLLINIAIYGRILDDSIPRESRFSASRWEYEEMLGDDEDGEFLTLRDCFNKIIHAEDIDHEMVLPEVHLMGRHQNKKEWCARIFIMPFCVSVFEWAGSIGHTRIDGDDVGVRNKS